MILDIINNEKDELENCSKKLEICKDGNPRGPDLGLPGLECVRSVRPANRDFLPEEVLSKKIFVQKNASVKLEAIAAGTRLIC